MSFLGEVDPDSEAGKAMTVFGLLFGSGVLVALAAEVPFVLLGLGILAFLAWAGTHTGVFAGSDNSERAQEPDPAALFQERSARGELSDEEFEHRLTTILETDELVGQDAAKPERDRDLLTERTEPSGR